MWMNTVLTKADQQIRLLYAKEFSAPVIASKLDISLNRVYRSLRKQKIQRRSPSEQNRIRFDNSPLSFRFKQHLNSRERELLIATTMLYYGEGAKNGSTVDFANSDPRTLTLFLKFLRIICRVDETRLRFYLYCFENQNATNLINFWTQHLKVKNDSFTKPYVRKNNGDLKRVMPYGALHIRYSDKRLLHKILSLINEIANQFN